MVSIIIPMYNSEKHIYKCVKSIEEQNFKDIEIIIVNDGSTDKSKRICNQLQIKYSNIIVIDVENGGVSRARNIGIEHAQGEYIQFVDSDDTVDSNYTEYLVKALEMNNVDMSICAYTEVTGKRNIKIGFENKKFTYMDPDFEVLLHTNRLLNSPCNKLYKKKLIQHNFPENISLGEDLIFNLYNFKGCKSLYFINQALYNYISQKESLTTKFRESNILDIIAIDKVCCKLGFDKIYLKNFMDNLFDIFCIMSKDNSINIQDKKKIISRLCDNDYINSRIRITNSNLSVKVKVLMVLLKKRATIGLYIVIQLLTIKNKLKRKRAVYDK